MKLAIAKFYPAHSSNQTAGRGGNPIDRITIHHVAGNVATLRHLWADPARNGSSHFFVSATAIEQYVDTDNTAWTNGNFASNQRALTIEVNGDWRNGYHNQAALNNLQKLLFELRKRWPNARLTYHMDETSSSTLCPADLKHKGYAKQVWDKVTAQLNPPKPTPTPTPSKISYRTITPKRVILTRNANLWDFNFTDWSKAKAVQSYPAGHIVDVVAEATNALGGKYLMTAYSYNNGAIRATNGFNTADVKDYVPPKPVEPPAPVVPKWQPMATPRKMRAAVDLRVYDLDAKKEFGDVIKKGTDIDLVEKITTDKMYLRSRWAKDNNKNWGIDAGKLEEMPVAPPVVEPEPPKPIDTDPTEPGDSDVVVARGIIETIKQLLDKLLYIILKRS